MVVGEGDDEARLQGLVDEKGLQAYVIFAKASNQNELTDFYSLADYFAMPSTGEGFGLVFLEAAASGLPVLAGNQDGSSDALRDGEIGLLVNPEDPNELMRGLKALIENSREKKVCESVNVFSFSNFKGLVQKLI
jgi:glycosyltransferase involved in cell wall biosynthesis